MVKFKLVPFIVRVKQKHTNEFVHLNNMDEQDTDFLEILNQYFQEIQTVRIIENNQKTISVEQVNSSGRNIYGVAKSGEYGIDADFFDIETSEVIPHARRSEHSETFPFFFYFHLPIGLERGILILQMYKVYGIKTILERTINEYLDDLGFVIELNRLISQTLLEQLEQSRLVELQLIRYDVPRDVADQVHDGSPEEIFEKRSFHVKYKKEINPTELIRNLLSDRETVYYEILGTQYDEIKAIIETDGSKITLTFGDQDIYRESMPLDGDIPLERGFPTYNYLLRRTTEYSEHLRNNLGE
ncbi:MAG: hypothetical protein PHH85_13065 [Candidatus Methanoperedens sp.]|nr:hypothetical protein [Candidatus Methanoperedens sp.]